MGHDQILIQLDTNLIDDVKDYKQASQVEAIRDWLDTHILYNVKTKQEGDLLYLFVYGTYKGDLIRQLNKVPNKTYGWKVISRDRRF